MLIFVSKQKQAGGQTLQEDCLFCLSVERSYSCHIPKK